MKKEDAEGNDGPSTDIGDATSESRRHPRELVLKTGRVHPPSSDPAVACAVFNISASGACILVPRGVELPDVLVLGIDGDRTLRHCEVVWRKGELIGLAFNDDVAGGISSGSC